MALNEIEGITLKSTFFREKSKIVKVYTNERGLLSFFVGHISRKNLALISFGSACTLSEITYLDKQKDLLRVKEVNIKNLYLPLRDSYEKINAAISITKALLVSQIEDKPNIILFNLSKKYLEKLSTSSNPIPYVNSFQLKLLQIEGLINLNGKCSICNQIASYAFKGAFFCNRHKSENFIQLELIELKILMDLAKVKRFSELETISISSKLMLKIQKIFLSCFN